MKKKLVILIMCVFAVLTMASTAAAAIGDWVIITVPMAPTFGYTSATRTDEDDEMQYGMAGEIVGTDTSAFAGIGPVYLVNTQYNYDQGYLRVNAGEYKLVSRAEGLAWRDAQTHWIIANFADILPKPNLNSPFPLITVPKGSLVKVVEDKGFWGKVELADTIDGNTHGYIRMDMLRVKIDRASPSKRWDVSTLSEAEKDAIRNQIAEDALSYTNSIYRWAGKTPLGLDCSGHAGMSFMLNGINTYRNSRPEPGSNIWILSDNEFINGTGAPVQRPMAGFPMALKHIDTPANTPTSFSSNSTHTLASLEKAKPGDTLYWSGHQGMYIGNGEFVHANGSSGSCRRNSLLPNQNEPAPTRTDLNTYNAIYTWGTAIPDFPNEILVGRLVLTRTGTRAYRIVARIDGYMPSRAEFYPCGVDASGNPLGVDRTTTNPIVHNITTAANMRYMLIDVISTTSTSAPSYTYPADANGVTYRPAIKFINETGYRPNGNTITSDIYVYPENLTVN